MKLARDPNAHKVIGGSIIWRGLSVEVTVKAARTVGGKMKYLVAPVRGSGEIWVDALFDTKHSDVDIRQHDAL